MAARTLCRSARLRIQSWLKRNYGVSPVASPEEATALIDKAQAKYQKPFEEWAKPFFEAADR
jgi:hypothetical protein